MSRTRRTAVMVAVVALALPSGCAATAEPSSAKHATLEATGYALEGSAKPADITRDGSYLRTIGIDGVTLDGPDGVTPVSEDAHALRRAAQEQKRKAVLLVSNYTDALQDFDEPLAHEMLTSASNRAAVVAALVDEAQDFDGVQLDLESLAARDLDGLTAFTQEVRAALPPSKQVSMAFMASTNDHGYRARGYDLAALSRSLDRMVLMAYDQHGPWSGPGPVGSLPWVRKELTYFASRVPNAKVDLGVAAYGYQWKGSPDTLTVAQARKRAGAKARWSAKDAEWHAKFSSCRTIWWSDQRSLRAREKLARSVRVHGVAIWEIGSSGPLR